MQAIKMLETSKGVYRRYRSTNARPSTSKAPDQAHNKSRKLLSLARQEPCLLRVFI